jgi:hypothetical protein
MEYVIAALQVIKRLFVNRIFICCFLALGAVTAFAEDTVPVVYQRNREIVSVSTGHGHFGGHLGHQYGVPYAYPWFTPQVVAGTWYERPYPYHFDYYRWRYSMPPIQAVAPTDCPCADIPADEPIY